MDQDQRAGRSNPPPELKEKVEALARSRALVKRLTKRLKNAQKECDRLENELVVYLDVTAIVHACPPEVLSVIFRFYLEENPRLSRRLMLVCRRWHNALVNDPTLWTRIPIQISTGNPKLKDQVESESLFITACVQRSRSCLLNITLDLPLLQTTSTYLMRKLHELLKDIFSGSDEITWAAIETWVEALDFGPFDTLAMNTTSCPYHVLKMVKLLVGNGGSHMQRWRSLHLTLPTFDEHLAFEVWKLFEGDTPNLVELGVHRAGSAYDEFGEELHGSFPNLSAVKSLFVGSTPSFDFLTLDPDSLEKMYIVTDIGRSGSLELNRFRALTVLWIFCPSPSSPSWNSGRRSPTTILHLPHLESLNLSGNFIHIDAIHFDLPALQDLTLDSTPTEPLSIAHKLPNVNAPTIWWSFHDTDPKLHQIFRELLRRLLLYYKDSPTLHTHPTASKALYSVIKELDIRGSWPGNWKYITAGSEEIWIAADSSLYWSDSDWTNTEFSGSE